ncbi:MAG: paraquat-inducible protein A [Sulfurovum sp.]|nr:paraquat-inducible protein A [Sulfurovum sp.]
MKKAILYVLMSTVLAAMLFFGVRAYTEAKAYEVTTAKRVAQMDAKSLATYQAQEWAEKLSFGLYKNKKREALRQIEQQQQRYRKESKTYTLYAMGALLILLLGYFVLSLRAFTFFGAAAAGIMLFFGLTSPILMVTIHKEVEYLGDVVLSFESKSVIGSIAKLFESGDAVVAVVILLFSVIVPLVKTLSLMFVSVFMQSGFAHGIVKFFKMIGKWSMVDVFVVATFLVYLTVNKGDVSRAEVEVGLYFFLAYVIVSMLVSLSADKMLHQAKGI